MILRYPVFLTDNAALSELYNRISLYIDNNYPRCLVKISETSVKYGYPDEYTRMALFKSKDGNALVFKISQDVNRKMDHENGLCYRVEDWNTFNELKFGIRVIMEMKLTKTSGGSDRAKARDIDERNSPGREFDISL